MSARARVLAPAKVNLALHVLARRPDGYHELDTLFQALDLCDRVEVQLTGSGVTLAVEGPDLGPPEQNLAYRAATSFLDRTGIGGGARVRLEKRIPVGAGLGGGSSDAAAVLRCLSALAGGVPADVLHAIGAGLGSDVPFFLGTSPLARGRGRGELLEPLPPLPAADFLLVSPPVHVSTAAAYAALAAGRTERTPPPSELHDLRLDGWEALAGVAGNDFEPVMADAHPEIGRALAALRAAGASVAMMTGSGSTCFGLFPDPAAAARASRTVASRTGWASVQAKTLVAFPEVERL